MEKNLRKTESIYHFNLQTNSVWYHMEIDLVEKVVNQTFQNMRKTNNFSLLSNQSNLEKNSKSESERSMNTWILQYLGRMQCLIQSIDQITRVFNWSHSLLQLKFWVHQSDCFYCKISVILKNCFFAEHRLNWNTLKEYTLSENGKGRKIFTKSKRQKNVVFL